MRASKRDWMFRVQVPGLEKNDVVFVVGNLPELGAWNHNQAIQLTKEHSGTDEASPAAFENNGSSDFTDFYGNSCDGADSVGDCSAENSEEGGRIFSQNIALPSDADVQFRYFVAVVCEPNGTKNSAKTLIIRKWETHMSPRQIKKDVPSNICAAAAGEESLPDPDKFGYHNGYRKIERGWLTDETVIQFKLFNNPIKLWKNRLQNKKVQIKMTPVNLVRHNSLELQQFGGDCVDDSLSMDTQDIVDQPAFSITEIAVMNDEEAQFKYQAQFGRAYDEDGFLIFNVAVRYPETVAYLVDYYVYTTRSFPGEPPNHIGFSYILPSTLQSSVGQLTVPITSTKHRPIGQLTVEYVTIKPIPDFPWDMSISYAKHWEQRWSGLDVGHRGLGTSFTCEMKNCANVRENTVASLKTASYHGADMVEFDVQLSKDLIPVIYHDFYVSISLKRKKQIDAMDMLEIPVKDLTLQQLHLLKLYHLEESKEKTPKFFDEDLEDHQPFPTLQTVLQDLDQHVGFNIEIKWTMQLKDGTFELNHPFDLNLYLDTILKVVLEHGGDRKIVFSSFNPDICAMMRLKQNKYPVVFLTQGVTVKYPTYHDPRCQTIPMAMRHAVAADILGINVHTEDILRDPSQVKLVKDRGLVIFCWGDDNNDKDTIQHLKKLGLHAVIYDKIDEYNAKDVKESIFLVDARESQKALIALAQCNQQQQQQQTCATSTTAASLAVPFVSSSTVGGSESDDSVGGASVSLANSNCDIMQQDKDIRDLTKDFSVCAATFGQPSVKMVCNNPPEIRADDELAKDCL
ncbi:glycerophosphocholine phosphodiesterase GPCPD1 isoform X2 [Nasonia vitripennis]|uniref:GP-PDE domain-containing protein n=1 Tax=Nasonia vitripennis TaxID=7425 RepID=A0A7M7QPN1_NASVI|nr:glycerophosphocholine phosphodiesterase GPCPD1 isoform X2 [Nasonia vitripennis]XP_032452721.1 glycerophosphocholine phosphodiesterase GPCPD1 isoform X2 [Nasonia vitripennis]